MQYPDKTLKERLLAARGRHPETANSFFISRETGEIVHRAWRDNHAWFENVPVGTFEVHISRKRPFACTDTLQRVLRSSTG
ncbi:hypothetical protein G4O51_11550 [Candidatus Bathyarchaeota archaeon A05DMB-2]|jgi:hypothetical protein|nr:hypothetical protein [Candidatus Bathyarchaeota archaeon A05DMB-2]